jgi:hypothetical protein
VAGVPDFASTSRGLEAAVSDGSNEGHDETVGAPPPAAAGDEPTDDRDLETIEIVTTEVDDDGTVMVDDLVAEVDSEGHVVATDELVEIDLPDGTVIVDETFSVADESGELVVVDEETTVLTPEEESPEASSVESNGNSGA